MSDVQIAVTVFAVTYAFIVSERVHKTTAALVGALTLVALKILDTEQFFDAIDLNVIFLLAGMMMIANTLSSTGVFQWAAIRATKSVNGSPWGVLVILALFTAVASAFLDNVTTVVLIAPVALVVARTMDIPVVPGLIAIVLASNIGGTATLIGDPPNILIASHADIDFVTFFLNVGPVSIITLAGFLVVAALVAHWKTPVLESVFAIIIMPASRKMTFRSMASKNCSVSRILSATSTSAPTSAAVVLCTRSETMKA